MRNVSRRLSGEDGHIGNGLASIFGIAAAVGIIIAFAADSDIAGIIGGVCAGLGIVLAVNAPHQWLRRVYPRLDKLDPHDAEAHPELPRRIEF